MVSEEIKVGDVVVDKTKWGDYGNINVITELENSYSVIFESDENGTCIAAINHIDILKMYEGDKNNFILKLLGKSKIEEHRTTLKKILKKNLEDG